MQFNHLMIKNFRNFEDVNIDLSNRNIVFGLNDIGKSNFLSALRFLLDRNFRKDGFKDTDFFNKEIEREIEITLEIIISDDEEDDDNKKIFTMMKGAIDSESKIVLFQIKSKFDIEKSVGEPTMFWGTDINELEDIPSNQSFFEIDKYINVIYVDSSIKLENIFKKYTNDIFRKESSIQKEERKELEDIINQLNSKISEIDSVKGLESELVGEYKKFRDEKGFNLSIKSEIEIGNLHDKLCPYILDYTSKTYPTSGEGRKKILAYTLLTLENRRHEEKKINIFLIEEIENHLHRSMQLALSYEIFSDNLFRYLFLTTHSSHVVSRMDQVNLIKLIKEGNVIGKSYIYIVPDEYKLLKQKLNQNLAEAIYADVVLLVEGSSEKTLFSRILNDKCERYESMGGYILEVDGINFIEYYKVLNALGIKVIIKTDNDVKINESTKEINLLGINRCLILMGEEKEQNISRDKQTKDLNEIELKKFIYNKKNEKIKAFELKQIYLSKVDLENDLNEVIEVQLDNLANKNNSKKSGVDYLQTSKLVNMIELCNVLTEEDINSIYNHERFQCLKKLVELCCQ